MNTAVVNKKGARRVRGGHLWIYRSDVVEVEAEGGATVTVLDEAHNFVGYAFYSDSSEITLRIFSTRKEETDRDFWQRRIREAIARRDGIAPGSDSYRLVNSESDLVPSLIVDAYGDVLVMQTLSQGTETLKATFADILSEELSPRAILERNDARVRERENLPPISGVLRGEDPGEISMEHDGLRFVVSPLGGQKTGSFLDQRENHAMVRRYAHGRALDCFTFNGGFALNLAKVCDNVLALDISTDAIATAEINARLNAVGNVVFKEANVFDALREMEAARESFDTIVLDPPAFVKSKAALRSAVRGYKEINLRALKLLSKNGILVTCSCSYHFNEALFLETIEEAARDAKRRVQLLEKRGQPIDHPVLVGMPESHYLKCLVLRVID
jgi:23S rRNA (cytosine1962-C5)-methyltransferase